ncbi:MAG TPA: MFS transporter [Gemmatimonadaceae bacterium]
MKEKQAVVPLAVLSLAIVLAMAPWFAATVVAESLGQDLSLTNWEISWLTLAVQLGFVVGSVVSAVFVLSDRYNPRRLAAIAAIIAGVATAVIALPSLSGSQAIAMRFVTGAALACVYPPGMKIAAGWTQRQRGTAIGILVGAVTVGSAGPHLLRATLNVVAWRPVVLLAGGSAILGALLFAILVREGPFQAAAAPFDPRAVGRVLRERDVRLATGGYLGHMWELYAMWSTIGIFLSATGARYAVPVWWGPVLAFVVIAVGAIGSVVAGVKADQVGRARVTIIAMAVSGTCALGIGPLSNVSYLATIVIALVWGISVVADSAQFSACVAEAAPREYVGTALTLQTASGFLLTMLTIHLVPGWAARWGWEVAYMPLAIGPLLGIACMARLGRAQPNVSSRG